MILTMPRIWSFAILFVLFLVAGCGRVAPASTGGNSPVQVATQDQPAVNSASEQTAESVHAADSTASADQTAKTSVEPAVVAAAPAPTAPTQRPRADREPTRPGDAEKITFDDLNLGMPADVVFREFMLTDRVKELDGKRVRLAGYIHAGQSAQRGFGRFVLLKNTQCKFGPGGQADHLTDVVLREGLTIQYTPSDVRVEGTFRIEPFQGTDGNSWSIYRLEDAQIR